MTCDKLESLAARLDRLALIIAAIKAIYRGYTDNEIRVAEERLQRILAG